MLARLFESLRQEGVVTTAYRVQNTLKWRLRDALYRSPGLKHEPFEYAREFFREHGINICYNSFTPEHYDPAYENVLLAVESPGRVREGKWIQPHMEFVAEVSWEQVTDAPIHHCPRSLYTTYDEFVDFSPERDYTKERSVSYVYSDERLTEGHRLRHDIADAVGDRMDCYGTGTGTFLEEKEDALASYRFHVAVENVAHPEYVTEKFWDPIKTLTVPVYWAGCESIKKLGFDLDGVLFFETTDELAEILDGLSPDLYEEMLPAARYNRRRLAEIRNEQKAKWYLRQSVGAGYMHSVTRNRRHGETDRFVLSAMLRPEYLSLNAAPDPVPGSE